jgi:hypothetical protein
LDLPSYPMLKQSKINHACIALHNFIKDSKMADELFDKCDEDEEYMPIPLCHRDSRLGDEEGAMNYFQDQIVNACTVCKENVIYLRVL